MLIIYVLTFINMDECSLKLLAAAHPIYNMGFRGCLSLEG